MKIKDIVQQPSFSPVAKKGDKSEGKEIDFQQFLKDATAKRSEDCKTAPPTPSIPDFGELSAPVLSVSSLNGLSEMKGVDPIRSHGMKAAENVLGMLDQYQKAIGDPHKSLRQMDSLVRSLSKGVKILNTLAEKVPQSDPLQKIMTELGVLSTVEIEKFNRGEYL